MIQFTRIANLVLGAVNLALFALWLSMIRRDAIPPGGGEASYMLSEASLLVTILGVMLGVGAIFLAGLGFFGFQAVLERSETKADKTAREVVAQLFQNAQEGKVVLIPGNRPLPPVGEVKAEKDL